MELYWRRDEAAISETERRLGGYLMTIARNVLGDKEDAREMVNDTCLAAWNSIPPARPEKLSLFLGKIAREKAIDRLRYASRKRRASSEGTLSLSELSKCVPAAGDMEEKVDIISLTEAIEKYLLTLPRKVRIAFVGRHYYMDPQAEIGKYLDMSENRVKSQLFRARQGLREYLEKEGLM